MTELVSRITHGARHAEYQVGGAAAEPSPGPGPDGTLEDALGAIIAERVREFRLQLALTVGQLAELTGLSKGMLSKIENAQASPSLATLARLSEALKVPVTAFFRGLNEEQDVLFVKAGRGLDIQHKGAGPGHRYQSLGTMRAPHNSLENLLVTLTERADTFPLYQHAGTELIYMISGRMEYLYGSSRYVLEPGDALQFVGEVPHGPNALIELPIQFLAVKSIQSAG
jgi:transcriptional regulator with XRE-family HTH domain